MCPPLKPCVHILSSSLFSFCCSHILINAITVVRMMAAPLGSVIKISKKMKKTKKAPAFLVMDRKTGKLIPEIIPQRVRVIMKTVYGNKLGKKGLLLSFYFILLMPSIILICFLLVVLTNRAIRLLERVTINQGLKLDHPSSVNSIETFIYYYKINTEELNDPIESFKCFNEFFYRKLADGARPIASPEVPVSSSSNEWLYTALIDVILSSADNSCICSWCPFDGVQQCVRSDTHVD